MELPPPEVLPEMEPLLFLLLLVQKLQPSPQLLQQLPHLEGHGSFKLCRLR
jgi:hypothetical protein